MQKILFGVIAILFIGIGIIGFTSITNNGSSEPSSATENTSESMNMENSTSTTETGTSSTASGSYTLEEVSAHASASDCYSVINGEVYDLTSFVGDHPGGPAILKICGKDGTALFEGQHGGGADQAAILETLKIGVVAQ